MYTLNGMLRQVFTSYEDQLEVNVLWSKFHTYYDKIKNMLGDVVKLINKVLSSMKKS